MPLSLLDQLPEDQFQRPSMDLPVGDQEAFFGRPIVGELTNGIYFTDGRPSSPVYSKIAQAYLDEYRQTVEAETNKARLLGHLHGRIVKVGIGAGAAAALVASGGGHAHADQSDTFQGNSPSQVQVGVNVTLYKLMLEQGYTPAEVVDQVHAMDPNADPMTVAYSPGRVINIDPGVQDSRRARLGEGVTLTLDHPGDTFYDEALKIGVADDMGKILKAYGKTNTWATHQKVGSTLPVPPSFLDMLPPADVTPAAPPAVLKLTDNDSINHELSLWGIDDMAVTRQVLADNGLTEEEARHMHSGDTFMVEAKFFPPPAAETTAVIEITSAAVPQSETIVPPPTPVDQAPAPILPAPETASTPVTTAVAVVSDTLPPPADVPAAPMIVDPATVDAATRVEAPPPPPPEVLAPPPPVEAVVAPQTLNDKLNEMRANYPNAIADVGEFGRLLIANQAHPAANPDDGLDEATAAQLLVLPDRQPGVNFVVNPATCSDEAYASPQMLAFIITLQDYARWLTENDPRFTQYLGFEFEIGDIGAGGHKTHQFTKSVDLRSRFAGVAAELHPDGPLFMSGMPGFDKDFTEAVYSFAHNMTYDGISMLKRVITASGDMEEDLTHQHKKGDWVSKASDHPDHTHFDLNDEFQVGEEHTNAHGKSCDDPGTGGHTPFEQPADPSIFGIVPATPVEAPPPPEVVAPAEETAPLITIPEIISLTGEYKFVDAWQDAFNNDPRLTAEQKAFAIQVGEAIMAEIQKGAPINGPAVWAQALWEGGWGAGLPAIEGFNIFGVKEGDRAYAAAHPDEFTWIHDDESNADGSDKLSPFVKYDSYESAIHNYIKMITTREYYADAVACRSDIQTYLEGLIDELRQDCSIGRYQGEDGVTSYGTNKDYIETMMSFIHKRGLDTLMVPSGGIVNLSLSAVEQWLNAA